MLRKIIVTAFTALSVVAASVPAMAQDRVSTQVEVSTYGVDFSNPDQTQDFYDRLRQAAYQACQSDDNRDLDTFRDDRACAAEALDKAVAEINTPQLSYIHANGHTRLASN